MPDLIDQAYRDALGRPSTASERVAHLARLADCSEQPEQVLTSLLPTSQSDPDARIVRLYQAFFARPPDQSGLSYWSSRVTATNGLGAAALAFGRSSEFRRTYGSLDDADFVRLVYRNVLGRAPDQRGLAYWTARLGAGTTTRADLMARFSESAEHVRRATTAVAVVRVAEAMLRRPPTGAELSIWLASPSDGTPWTPEWAALRIGATSAYAARF